MRRSRPPGRPAPSSSSSRSWTSLPGSPGVRRDPLRSQSARLRLAGPSDGWAGGSGWVSTGVFTKPCQTPGVPTGTGGTVRWRGGPGHAARPEVRRRLRGHRPGEGPDRRRGGPGASRARRRRCGPAMRRSCARSRTPFPPRLVRGPETGGLLRPPGQLPSGALGGLLQGHDVVVPDTDRPQAGNESEVAGHLGDGVQERRSVDVARQFPQRARIRNTREVSWVLGASV